MKILGYNISKSDASTDPSDRDVNYINDLLSDDWGFL